MARREGHMQYLEEGIWEPLDLDAACQGLLKDVRESLAEKAQDLIRDIMGRYEEVVSDLLGQFLWTLAAGRRPVAQALLTHLRENPFYTAISPEARQELLSDVERSMDECSSFAADHAADPDEDVQAEIQSAAEAQRRVREILNEREE